MHHPPQRRQGTQRRRGGQAGRQAGTGSSVASRCAAPRAPTAHAHGHGWLAAPAGLSGDPARPRAGCGASGRLVVVIVPLLPPCDSLTVTAGGRPVPSSVSTNNACSRSRARRKTHGGGRTRSTAPFLARTAGRPGTVEEQCCVVLCWGIAPDGIAEQLRLRRAGMGRVHTYYCSAATTTRRL